MSTYICGLCEEYKDTDSHGCFEHPTNKMECICDACEEEMLCYFCGESPGEMYCKITDQYYHDRCVE